MRGMSFRTGKMAPGMEFNRPQITYLDRAVSSGGIVDEPVVPESWSTTFVTETTATTYVQDYSDPYNEDITAGYIACDLTGMLEGDVIVIFCPWVSQSGSSRPEYLGALLNCDAQYINWSSYYLACVGVKRLTAADLISPPRVPVDGSLSVNQVRTWAYRGPTQAVIKETPVYETGTTVAFTGFVPAASHRGLMTLSLDRNTPSNLTLPSGFTQRGRTTTGNLPIEAADLLNGSYAGATFSWTGGTAPFAKLGAAVEFLA